MPRILNDDRDPIKKALGERFRHLQEENNDQLVKIVSELSPKEAEEIQYDQEIWLRENQWIDLSENNQATIVLALAGRGFGKAACINTPILTVRNGFVLLGELSIGDEIFDEKGNPTIIQATYDVLPEKAYRFYFNDGSHIDSCSEHQWVTWTHRDRKQYLRNPKNDNSDFPENWPVFKDDLTDCHGNVVGQYGAEIRTTQQIVDTFRQNTKRQDLNHCIPVSKPVKLPEKELLIDPYLLGYWIGDGSKGSGVIAVDDNDKHHILDTVISQGYGVGTNNGKYALSVLGLRTRLRKIGVLYNKIIPKDYLFSSIDQRIALLQGLMDSDGCSHPKGMSVEFCSKRKDHADAVLWLARSLGERPVLSEGRAILNGKDHGVKYRVTWRPKINPFRLERKVNLITPLGNQAFKQQHRMITSYEEIDPIPMRCLTVDSPNSMFLCGEALIPTHNTYAGGATIKRAVEKHNVKKILIMAYTSRDIRATLVPAIIGMYPPDHNNMPKWRPGEATLVWPNGAEAICIPSEAGEDSPRGLNTELILADEMASYGRNEGIIHQALLTLRHPPSKLIIMTTPKATPLLVEYLQRAKEGDSNIQLITGSTYDNKQNLSKAFMEGVVSKYEGTHLAQAELHGELVLSNPSALWQMSTIERNLVVEQNLPRMERYSLGVDPALLSRKSTVGKRTGRTPDKCGIVLSGQADENIYTLDNFSGSYNPEQMVRQVCAIYDMYSRHATMDITVEVNNLGEETLKMMFNTIDRMDVYKRVRPYFSTLGKLARAQPYALLTQQDKIKFVNKASMSQVFSELTSYTGDGGSPNTLDAAVFSWNNLKPTKSKFINTFELIM